MDKPSFLDTNARLRMGKKELHGLKPESITPRPQAPESQFVEHCRHKYRILKDNTRTIVVNGKPFLTNVSTIFYCEKCLNITHKEEEISYA